MPVNSFTGPSGTARSTDGSVSQSDFDAAQLSETASAECGGEGSLTVPAECLFPTSEIGFGREAGEW